MATAPSLFGPALGEEEMASRLLEERAMQFAQMPQNQRLAAMGYRAGNLAGRSIGSLFGVETQDPAVRRATMLRQMAQQYDTTTAAGLRQLAAALRQSDPEMALRVAQQADAMELGAARISSETALAAQRGREKAAADPIEQFIRSNAQYYTPASLKAYRDTGGDVSKLEFKEKPEKDPIEEFIRANANNFTPASLKAYKDSSGDLSKLEPKDKVKTEITEANGRVLLVNKDTGEIIKDLGKATDKATKITNVIPEKAGDVLAFRQNLITNLRPFRDAVNAADTGIELVNTAIRDNNFAAASAVPRQLAKAVGETQISNQDVKSFGIDPSLVGSAADVLSRLATGTITKDSLTQMKKVLQVVRKKNKDLEDLEITQTRRLAEQSGNFTGKQIQDIFNLRGEQTRSFNSVREAEAANLPKGTRITIGGRPAIVE